MRSLRSGEKCDEAAETRADERAFAAAELVHEVERSERIVDFRGDRQIFVFAFGVADEGEVEAQHVESSGHEALYDRGLLGPAARRFHAVAEHDPFRACGRTMKVADEQVAAPRRKLDAFARYGRDFRRLLRSSRHRPA